MTYDSGAINKWLHEKLPVREDGEGFNLCFYDIPWCAALQSGDTRLEFVEGRHPPEHTGSMADA
jgi:hypothetical protein